MKPVSSGEASEEGCDMASEADRMKIIVAAIKTIIFFSCPPLQYIDLRLNAAK